MIILQHNYCAFIYIFSADIDQIIVNIRTDPCSATRQALWLKLMYFKRSRFIILAKPSIIICLNRHLEKCKYFILYILERWNIKQARIQMYKASMHAIHKLDLSISKNEIKHLKILFLFIYNFYRCKNEIRIEKSRVVARVRRTSLLSSTVGFTVYNR